MEQLIYPEQLDESFFREVQYCLNDNIINGSLLCFASIHVTIIARTWWFIFLTFLFHCGRMVLCDYRMRLPS